MTALQLIKQIEDCLGPYRYQSMRQVVLKYLDGRGDHYRARLFKQILYSCEYPPTLAKIRELEKSLPVDPMLALPEPELTEKERQENLAILGDIRKRFLNKPRVERSKLRIVYGPDIKDPEELKRRREKKRILRDQAINMNKEKGGN